MSYEWIHPPIKLSKDEYMTIQDSAYVEIAQEEIPEDDLYRYVDSDGGFYDDDDDDDGDAFPETVYGYFYIAEDPEQLADPRGASLCVETRGSTYFVVGQHAETSARSNLGFVAERGELYLISLQDYSALEHGTPSTYLLDMLNTDRSAEDPYLYALEQELGVPAVIPELEETA